MLNINDYIQINRESWNQRVPVHMRSRFYNTDAFVKGACSLPPADLQLLMDVRGKDVLHLQCHFGMDSLSLSRLGARVTGVDFSDVAISQARALAAQLQLDAHFICSDIYELDQKLDQKFDVVYTSYGVLPWLPDLDRWAALIDHVLKPGGKVILVEFHPVVWMFDDFFESIHYSYFKEEAIAEEQVGTYVEEGRDMQLNCITWNHSLSETIGNLRKHGLHIEEFKEYNHAPYNCLHGMVELAPGQFVIEKFGTKLPLVFSVVACKSPI